MKEELYFDFFFNQMVLLRVFACKCGFELQALV